MELQEMKKLESEVKGLQLLMQEVHRNQVILNKALLNGSVCSRSKIVAGDPKVAGSPNSGIPEARRPETGAEMMLSSLQAPQAPGPQPETEEKREEGKRRKSKSQSVGGSKQKSANCKDFPEGARQGEMRMVRQKKESPAPGSSFIRNILDEDSRAGVAVVDLFLTVKMAKDNLRFLSRSNNEVFDKINYLKKETAAIGVGYRDLLEEMQNLMGRMSDSLAQRRKSPAAIHFSGEKNKIKFWKDEAGSQTPTGSRDSEDETARMEHVPEDAGGREKSKRSGRKGGCVGCFVSAHKGALFQELPELSEASLGSFLATLLRMQKGRQRFCESCEGSFPATPRPGGRESEGEPKLSDSAHRMFHDICEVLDGAAREDLGSDRDRTETEECSASRKGGRRSLSRDSRPNFLRFRRKLLRNGRSARNLRREVSESESEIDDAISSRPLTGLGLKAKPSVTCMGDLTRAVPGKKSASTLTTSSNGASFRKPSSGIRYKMKRIKSKCLKMEEVKVTRGSKKLPEKTEPKMKGGAPTEDLRAPCDALCVKRGIGDPAPRRATTQVHAAFASNAGSAFPSAFDDPAGVDYLSDDSFYNCDSESLAADYHSGYEDLEEFVEIFNKSSKAAGKVSAPRSFFGLLHETTLKTIKALFFEIQKCYPANFVQEILPKKAEATPKAPSVDASISLCPGENIQKRVVIEGSSTDFVLYIQVELDEGAGAGSRVVLEPRRPIAHETQAVITAESEDEDERHDVWLECEGSHPGEVEERERITFGEPPPAISSHREERETWNAYPVEREGKAEKIVSEKGVLLLKNERHRADVWLLQNGLQRLYVAVRRDPLGIVSDLRAKPPELEKALNLIREIENDVVEEKLSDAISILPRLEWELQKHVHSKMKGTGGGKGGVFPSVDFYPPTDPEEKQNDRMQNLLTMLRDLENAIKATESNVCGVALRHYDSSKVYDLLNALVGSIRGLEGDASMSNLSQTLEIASQLDTAVREYDGMIKKRPRERSKNRKRNAEGVPAVEAVPAKQHLENVRKKVFETVEDEATRLERRVEKSVARLDVLEKENDEVMTFLETFLQKTKRRMSELTNLKSELKKLSSSLRDMHANLLEKISRKSGQKEEGKAIAKADAGKVPQVGRSRSETENPRRRLQPSKDTAVRETVSGLLFALDSLKSRTREKKELCREILCPPVSEKGRETASSSRRSSRSSFTAKHADTLTSSMKEFRKIDETSLYLEWTSPEGPLKDCVSGFEIYVNGKLNQKVRNPRRLQAVLYSIDFTENVHLELYAVAENRPKMLLISEHRGEHPTTNENSSKFSQEL